MRGRPPQTGNKECKRCKEIFPVESFRINSQNNRLSRCVPCLRQESRDWRKANTEKQRACVKAWEINNPERKAYLVKKGGLSQYNLSVEQYNEMKEQQNALCGLCGTDKPLGKGDFCVDHDHETGYIRALLCHNCNRGMGLLRDSPERLRKAADYIELYKAKYEEEKLNASM